MAFFILATGIVFVGFSWSGILSMIFSKILLLLICILNYSVSLIKSFPNSTTIGISINTTEFLIIYMMIISLIIFISSKRKKYFFLAIISTLVLVGISVFKNYNHLQQRKISIYNIRKHSAIDFIEGNENTFICDSILFNDKNKINYHLQNHWWKLGLKITNKTTSIKKLCNFNNREVFQSKNFIRFYNKRILIIDKKFKVFPYNKKLEIDFAIISNNPKIKIKDIKKCFNLGLLIIDASNSYWNEKQWIKECEEENINIYSVTSSGAKIIDF